LISASSQLAPGRAEEGKGDLVVELLKGDLDRHVEQGGLGDSQAITERSIVAKIGDMSGLV
jgi:hypothetical protein